MPITKPKYSFEPTASERVFTAAIGLTMVANLLFPRVAVAAPGGGVVIQSRPVGTPSVSGVLPQAGARGTKKTMYVTVTAYSSTPDQTDDSPFTTANGTMVRDGIVAANFLRFGTRVRFPDHSGGKVFVVTDRMHPRFSDRMDIWMETREEARVFGIRRLKVEVY
ncbi:MAG: hypothetical protein AAB562_02800 [Patescibacteria group bacterium]